MKTLFILVAVLLLAGCTSPLSVMMNNSFVSVQPTPPPAYMVGTFTGNMGPYLATMVMGNDGNGILCSSLGGTNAVDKLKFSGTKIYNQSGGTVLALADGNRLILRVEMGLGADHLFLPDPELKQASIYCAQALKGGNTNHAVDQAQK
jgi:hypothetical protein